MRIPHIYQKKKLGNAIAICFRRSSMKKVQFQEVLLNHIQNAYKCQVD